jgi:hypothetical protein
MRVLDLEAIRTAPIDSYESLAAASAVIGEGKEPVRSIGSASKLGE